MFGDAYDLRLLRNPDCFGGGLDVTVGSWQHVKSAWAVLL